MCSWWTGYALSVDWVRLMCQMWPKAGQVLFLDGK